MANEFVAVTMAMLSENYIFFNEGEIAWNGEEHYFRGIQVNAPKIAELDESVRGMGYDDISDYVAYFQRFLLEIEYDREICVPRARIASGIRKVLPEGPLTGITLANLAACNGALRIVMMGDANVYGVLYDVRLSLGIPCFFNLVARMIWDLRRCSRTLRGKPFCVAFAGSRNFDADQYFGDVSSAVAGAQDNPVAIIVSSPPEINLDGPPFEVKDGEASAGWRLGHDQPCFGESLPESKFQMVSSAIALAGPQRVVSAIASIGPQRVAYAIDLAIKKRASAAVTSARCEWRDAERDLRALRSLQDRCGLQRRRFDQIKDEIDRIEAAASELADKLALHEETIDLLGTRLSELEEKRILLGEQISQTSLFSFGKRSALKREQEKLTSEIAESRQKLEEVNEEKSEVAASLEVTREQLDERKGDLDAARQGVARAEEELGQEAEAEETRLRERVDATKAAYRHAEMERDEVFRR